MPVQRKHEGEQNQENETLVRTILLLCDEWKDDSVGGVASINQSLALNLIGYEGVRVVCATIKPPDKSGQELNRNGDLQLLSLFTGSNQDLNEQYKVFNENPQAIWMKSTQNKIPEVSFIIGHFPGTAEAAVNLRNSAYPSSKLILFYHVIPEDVEWLAQKLPYGVPCDDDLIRLAEKADVVYSVTKNVHSFFQAKFLNRAQKAVDHRLFLPQSSKQAFDAGPGRDKNLSKDSLRVFVLAGGTGLEEWQGLDIAICAAAKVSTALKDKSGTNVSLSIGHVEPTQNDAIREALKPFLDEADLKLDLKSYRDSKELFLDISKYHLCLVPSRAEPFGSVGLLPFSIGIPTILAESSYLATIIKRLAVDPTQHLVRTTRDVKAVKQDAGLWKERIMQMIENKNAAERSLQLKQAAKTDEMTIQTHDNFVSYCLRGIKLKIEAGKLKFSEQLNVHEETDLKKRFSSLLLSLLKQSWRLKRHALIGSSDIHPLIPGMNIPLENIIKNVIDKIEDMDRRIVEVDEAAGSLVVYCPGRKSLRDLWAMSDKINKTFTELLFKEDKFSILPHFKLKEASTRIAIPGPDFLKYNEDLLLATA